MKDVLETIKQWFAEHPGIKKGLVIAGIALVVFTILRVVVMNLPEQEETEQDPLAGIELSSEQDKIIANYSDEDKKIVKTLKENRWVSTQKISNAEFNDKQIIERKNEEESVQTYAICGVEKTMADSKLYEEIYKFTILSGDGKYKQGELHIRRLGGSNTSAIDSIYIQGENLFKNADGYERCIPPTKITIENWDDNVNSLIDNKQDVMYEKIKEYLYLYYPQVDQVSWNGVVGINYYTHVVSLNFTILLNSTNTKFICCEYHKDTGEIIVGHAQSAESLTIKKSA